jgi:hypothetical protein
MWAAETADWLAALTGQKWAVRWAAWWVVMSAVWTVAQWAGYSAASWASQSVARTAAGKAELLAYLRAVSWAVRMVAS